MKIYNLILIICTIFFTIISKRFKKRSHHKKHRQNQPDQPSNAYTNGLGYQDPTTYYSPHPNNYYDNGSYTTPLEYGKGYKYGDFQPLPSSSISGSKN